MNMNKTMKILSSGFLSAMMATAFWGCNEDDAANNPPPEKSEVMAGAVDVNLPKGGSTTFKDETSGVTSRFWAFAGGEPKESTAEMVDVKYEIPGTYNAALTIEHADGSKSTKDIMVKVFEDLLASITSSADKTEGGDGYNVAVDLAFTLMDDSKGEPNNWEWTFYEDGQEPVVSNQQNPIHTFTTEGVFDVRLKISRDTPDMTELDSLFEDFLTVTKILPVTAGFTMDKVFYMPEEEVTFTQACTGTRDTYEWVFSQGVPSKGTGASVKSMFRNPGRHNVTLKSYLSAIKDDPNFAGYDGEITIKVPVHTPQYVCTTVSSNPVACGNVDGSSENTSEWVVTPMSASDALTLENSNVEVVYGVGGRAMDDGHIVFRKTRSLGTNLILGSTKFVADGSSVYEVKSDLYAEVISATGNAVAELTIYNASNVFSASSSTSIRQWQAPNDYKNQWSTKETTKATVLPAGEYVVGFRLYGSAAEVNWHVDNVEIVQK